MLKKNRIKLKWKKVNSHFEIELPKQLLNKKIDYTKVIDDYDEIKITNLLYGENFWIINEGHDFSRRGDILVTSSPKVASSPILIQWGSELKLKCKNNHEISSGMRFCPYCGIKVL